MTMRTGSAGLALIRRFEGCALRPYRDAAGKWTIGVGHLLKDGESYADLTPDETEALLRQDLDTTERAVRSLVTAPITQRQFDALVAFTFNLGAGNLAKSTLLTFVNAGEHSKAALEFPKWCRARGQILKGLVRRRLAEATLYLQD